MINANEMRYNKPVYYVPTYTGPTKVRICKINNDIAIVKPYSKKKEFHAFPIPLEFVCDSHEYAKRCGRAWEHWKRTQNKRK